MQKLNKEYTLTVLQHLREGKSEKEISLLTHKHRNTVSRHVSWLRQNMAYNPQDLTNQIVNKLKERLNDMTDRDLIHFLAIYMPQRIEAISLTKEVIENRDITIIADYTRAVEDAVNRDIEALRTRKQVDTPQTHAETS